MNPEPTSAALESRLRPETRAATSLGRLVARCLPSAGQPGKNGRLHWWSNRAGQDRGETFTIAALVALTVSGLVAGGIAARGGGPLAIALLLVPGFYAAIHVLIFAAAAVDALIRMLGIRSALPLGHFCGRLFLALLTVSCVVVAARPDSGGWLRFVAGAWCLVAAMNAAAWFYFVALSLAEFLAGKHDHDQP